MADIPTPSYYTVREGGDWKPWPKWATFMPGMLRQRHTHDVIVAEEKAKPNKPTIKILRVHSLGWGATIMPFKFPRWDCINGWTRELGNYSAK